MKSIQDFDPGGQIIAAAKNAEDSIVLEFETAKDAEDFRKRIKFALAKLSNSVSLNLVESLVADGYKELEPYANLMASTLKVAQLIEDEIKKANAAQQ